MVLILADKEKEIKRVSSCCTFSRTANPIFQNTFTLSPPAIPSSSFCIRESTHARLKLDTNPYTGMRSNNKKSVLMRVREKCSYQRACTQARQKWDIYAYTHILSSHITALSVYQLDWMYWQCRVELSGQCTCESGAHVVSISEVTLSSLTDEGSPRQQGPRDPETQGNNNGNTFRRCEFAVVPRWPCKHESSPNNGFSSSWDVLWLFWLSCRARNVVSSDCKKSNLVLSSSSRLFC